MQGYSAEDICQLCCQRVVECDSLVLLFRALAASLLMQKSEPEQWGVIQATFDDPDFKHK